MSQSYSAWRVRVYVWIGVNLRCTCTVMKIANLMYRNVWKINCNTCWFQGALKLLFLVTFTVFNIYFDLHVTNIYINRQSMYLCTCTVFFSRFVSEVHLKIYQGKRSEFSIQNICFRQYTWLNTSKTKNHMTYTLNYLISYILRATFVVYGSISGNTAFFASLSPTTNFR